MDATAKKILADLKEKKYAPVYLLQGEEAYYIDLISDYIESNVLNESEKSFNQFIIYGDDAHKDDGKDGRVDFMLSQARRYPMMAERQVVIVKEAQKMPLTEENSTKKLMLYLKAPVPTTILVLCHKYKPIDKRTELGKNIEKLTLSATFKKPFNTEKEYNEFANEYAKERGFMWEAKAAELLVEHVGDDLHRVANEIDKIILNKKRGEPITLSDVVSKVGVNRDFNNFELQRALLTGDVLKLFRIIHYFELSKNYSGIPTVALLFSFFSKLLIAHSTPDKSRDGLAAALKVSPFFVREYQDAMAKISLSRTQTVLSLLHEADLQLKGVNRTTVSDGQLIKETLLKIINTGK